MNTQRFPFAQDRRGFALVLTLSIASLLVILVVGLLLTLRSEAAGIASRLEQARLTADAQVGVRLAQGQLQRWLGTDVSVAARRAVLSPVSAAGAPPQPTDAWLGAWQDVRPWSKQWATEYSTKGFTDQRDRATERNGPRVDLGSPAGSDSPNSRAAWLVSAPVDSTDPTTIPGPAQRTILRYALRGLTPTPGNEAEIRVPALDLGRAGAPGNHLAWWTADNAAALALDAVDTRVNEANPAIQQQRLAVAQDNDLSGIHPNLTESRFADVQRLVTPRTLGLLADLGQNAIAWNRLDLARTSPGLLTDSARGGWRGDLSPFLQDDLPPAAAPGTPDPADLLVGPPNQGQTLASGAWQGVDWAASGHRLSAPRFAALRSHARLAAGGEVVVASGGNPLPIVENPWTSEAYQGIQEPGFFHNGLNYKMLSTDHRDSLVKPTLTEATIHYGLSQFRQPAGTMSLRLHLYPRATFWNPWDVPIRVPESMIALQVNGRLLFEFSGPLGEVYRNSSNPVSFGLDGVRLGTLLFLVPEFVIEPGETLMFSPQLDQLYSSANYRLNQLSSAVPPAPGRSFYVNVPTAQNPVGWTQEAVSWRQLATSNKDLWSEDFRAYWKLTDGAAIITFNPAAAARNQPGNFGGFRTLAYFNYGLQYGGNKEAPLGWSDLTKVPMETRTALSQPATAIPDGRTREGFRLRWLIENPTNAGAWPGNTGAAMGSAMFGNWNPRASYTLRNPFENVGPGPVPPFFWGDHTRDLPDPSVGWANIAPLARAGAWRGNPVGPPVEGSPMVLFHAPRANQPPLSLAALRHAELSRYAWHPAYAIGESLVDPRITGAGQGGNSAKNQTLPHLGTGAARDYAGWNPTLLGHAYFATLSRGILGRVIESASQPEQLVYDQSFELNQTLFDSWFLSGLGTAARQQWLADSTTTASPNGLLRPVAFAAPGSGSETPPIAARVQQEGSFNVNSTSVAAWEALLSTSRGQVPGDPEAVAFPRIPGRIGDVWDGQDPLAPEAWTGTRVLNRQEVRALAEAIVEQVRLRGPFISVADFVNRRLVASSSAPPELATRGALEAALEASGINAAFVGQWPLDHQTALEDRPLQVPSSNNDVVQIQDPTRMDQIGQPATTAWGASGFVTQGDILQQIGPRLAVRSDSFTTRIRVDSPTGGIRWVEAEFQRLPEALHLGADAALATWQANPDVAGAGRFGRRFRLVGLRQLAGDAD